MEELLGGLTPVLGVLALVATTVSLPLGLYQIVLGRREAQASRDLQVTLTLSESFRTRWESSWRRVLTELASDEQGTVSRANEDELFNMLNWVDWLGNLIECGHLANPDAVLGALGPQIRRIIEVGASYVKAETVEHGASYWRGLAAVARRVDYDLDCEQLSN